MPLPKELILRDFYSFQFYGQSLFTIRLHIGYGRQMVGYINMGVLDFAGGIVVHISAGIAAIIMAIVLGKRRDYKGHALPPHDITYVAMGTGMLWVGWFGFNGGSGLAANGLAGNAILVTHISAAIAALTWAFLEWAIGQKTDCSRNKHRCNSRISNYYRSSRFCGCSERFGDWSSRFNYLLYDGGLFKTKTWLR